MRAWIRPAALLIPALVISASCDDPDRPESGSWSGLEISWEDGYIAADLMPVVEPPPDYDPTSFAASFAIHNSGRSGYSGLEVESADETSLTRYVRTCAQALAHAHGRSGSASAISGYLGSSTVFDEAIEQFAVDYADQTDRDYAALQQAEVDGRIEVRRGV